MLTEWTDAQAGLSALYRRLCSSLGVLTLHPNSTPTTPFQPSVLTWVQIYDFPNLSWSAATPALHLEPETLSTLQHSDSAPVLSSSDCIQTPDTSTPDTRMAFPTAPGTHPEGPRPQLTATQAQAVEALASNLLYKLYTGRTFQAKKAFHWPGSSSKSNKHPEEKCTHWPRILTCTISVGSNYQMLSSFLWT